MTRVIRKQLKKSEFLLKGLRRNIRELTDKGITLKQLDEMEENVKVLARESAECEALHRELSRRVKVVERLYDKVRVDYLSRKSLVKGHFRKTEWRRFGVGDLK
ncbi:MAG: hypothetical protein IJV27_07670 [Prevotella sp.]|nr:hypothetical protein [Prevotella sp.]